MFPGTKEGGILVTNEAVHVYGDGLYATMRTLGCDFPNYQAIIPTGKCVSYEFVKKDLVVPLERLGLLSGIAPFVKFTFSSQAKMLYLTAKSETGEGYEAMQCDPVVDQELTLNLKQLLDAVEHIDEDKVTMEFHASPNDGMVVVRSGDYVHVLSTIN
jgi:DNA polymerase III sliding clamp (beta) subunit (PCNA family)